MTENKFFFLTTTILIISSFVLFSCVNPTSFSYTTTSSNQTNPTTTNTSQADFSGQNITGNVNDDLYENFTADQTVTITFSGSSATASISGSSEVTASSDGAEIGSVGGKPVTISRTANSEDDESAEGFTIQYKGSSKIKYVLSGTINGTLTIKNKNADAAVVLNNLNITSTSAGPALRFTSPLRTFIVVPAGTNSTLTDSRQLNQTDTMYDSKKGSVYTKGALIFTGESSSTTGGSLTVVNTGYKHGIYARDYVRIADITLNVTVGNYGRDCIRTVSAAFVDAGSITLNGNGNVTDDESAGIRVDGEDADSDDSTVYYNKGAGFIVINGGTLNITTVAKGITAHWKSSETCIGSYTDDDVNTSLLLDNLLSSTTYSVPNPFVTINGGTINITTTGTPYEYASGASCSPEGIEAKANILINNGNLSLTTTDDSINAGGAIKIAGGRVYAYSSKNDAIDANGTGGIEISGGYIVARGTTTPECAFDCDTNLFAITGGYVVGIGTNNYSPLTEDYCTQYCIVGSSSAFTANQTFAICDSSGNAVFAYTIPSSFSSIIISTPALNGNSTYTVRNGVSASGSSFNGMYYDSISLNSTGSTGSSFTTSSYVSSVGSVSNNGSREGTR